MARPPPMRGHYGQCPQCGDEILYKEGKHGPFWGCVDYPNCTWSADIGRPLGVTEADVGGLALRTPSRGAPTRGTQVYCIACRSVGLALWRTPGGLHRPLGWRADYCGHLRCPDCWSINATVRPDRHGGSSIHVSDEALVPASREQVDFEQLLARSLDQGVVPITADGDPYYSGSPARVARARRLLEDPQELVGMKVSIQTEKVKTMEIKNKKTHTERALDGAKDFGNAAALGVQLAGVKVAGDKLLELARKLGRDQPWVQALLATEEGREALKLVMAGLVQQFVVHAAPEGDARLVRRVCALQVTSSTAMLAAPMLAEFTELISSFVSIGKTFNISDAELVEPEQLTEGAAETLPTEPIKRVLGRRVVGE